MVSSAGEALPGELGQRFRGHFGAGCRDLSPALPIDLEFSSSKPRAIHKYLNKLGARFAYLSDMQVINEE